MTTTSEITILREQIAWHEAREDNPPPPYNPIVWAACLAGLRFRLRELLAYTQGAK